MFRVSLYTVIYKNGEEIYLADTLSRSITKSSAAKGTMQKEEIFPTAVEKEVEDMDMTGHISVSAARLEELKQAT